MAMTHDEANRLKDLIAHEHPELTLDLREYEGVWTVLVTNPRTNEGFGIVSATDWQERLDTLQGVQPRRSGVESMPGEEGDQRTR